MTAAVDSFCKWWYFWPVPTNKIGAFVTWVMVSAAPTLSETVSKRLQFESLFYITSKLYSPILYQLKKSRQKLLPLFKLSAHHKWDKRRTEIVLMSIRLMLLFVSSSLPANHIITMQNTLESIGLHPSIIRIIRSDQCPDAILASGMILLSKVMTVGTVSGTEF